MKNKGNLPEYFTVIEKWTRGSSIILSFFIIVVELLSAALKDNPLIKRIEINNSVLSGNHFKIIIYLHNNYKILYIDCLIKELGIDILVGNPTYTPMILNERGNPRQS